jgi:hypothetical protein
MTPGLLEILRLATGMAQLYFHSNCKSSPAVDSSRHGRTGMARSRTPKGSFMAARRRMRERVSEEWATGARMQE